MEGHSAFSMFFIISGEVLIARQVYDKIEKRFFDTQVRILGGGDFFGETDLIYNQLRDASCTTESKLVVFFLYACM